jgi:hypothetical protein
MSEMNKAEIVAELEAMTWHRLFNCHQWLADRETVCAVNQKLMKMGLVESTEPNAARYTPLGMELDLDLFEVFMGLFDEWEVPLLLNHYGFIDECEADDLYARMSEKVSPEAVLVRHVRRAYLDFGKATKFLH